MTNRPNPPPTDAPPTAPIASAAAPPSRSRTLLETVPAWVQALTALLGLAVTVFGISFVATNQGNRASEAGEAEVRLLSSSVGDGVSGTGEYLRLRTDEQEVVLLVRLEGAEEWTPIEVTTSPSRLDDEARTEDGTWTARAPIRATTATFLPVVVRAGVLGIQAPHSMSSSRRAAARRT